jgi:hypothetical protein
MAFAGRADRRQESAYSVSTQVENQKKQKLLQISPPLALCRWGYKTLHAGNAQAQIEGDRAQEARGPRMDQGRPFRGRDVREKKERFLVTFCRLAKSYPLAAGQRKPLIIEEQSHWIPASAGMTINIKGWIPASAGMTSGVGCRNNERRGLLK